MSAPASLPPTKTAELWSCPRETSLTLASGERLSQVVDLGLFGPFVAGLTLEDAARLKGAPEATFCSPHHSEWRYALYRLPESFVEVAYEPGGSSCGTYHRRTVYAYPLRNAWPFNRVFREPLLKRIHPPPLPTRLLVMEAAGREERAWFLVDSNGVTMANWFRLADGGTQR